MTFEELRITYQCPERMARDLFAQVVLEQALRKAGRIETGAARAAPHKPNPRGKLMNRNSQTMAAGSRPVGTFEGYVDGAPSVTWLDHDFMPEVGATLYAVPRSEPQATAFMPRHWSLLLLGENYGHVGPVGNTFPHAGERHERVLVVEVPPAAGAPVDQVDLRIVAAPAGDALTDEQIATRAIEREVAAQAGQVAVPEGWRLVPVEPTEEMVGAGFESAPDEFFSPAEEWEAYAEMTGCQKAAHRARLCYAAMLAAAPASPAVAQQAAAQAKPLANRSNSSSGSAQASTSGERQEGGAA